ncbi:MAG TPA: hypothetical protein VGD29_02555 [Actinoplanes sp.]|jgi:hypothetical protein
MIISVRWYRPGVDDEFLPSLKKSPKFIKFLEAHYGKFPLPTVGLVLVDSDSAMETQQMVTLGDRIEDDAGVSRNR